MAKTIDQITKNNQTTHMIRLTRRVKLKMRNIEQSIPPKRTSWKITEIYMIKNKMASPTYSCAETLKEPIMCPFTGIKLSARIQLSTLANAYCYKKSIKYMYAIA